MELKNFWAKIKYWLYSRNILRMGDYIPRLNHDGLISTDTLSIPSDDISTKAKNNQVIVKAVQQTDKNQSLEKLQAGFDNLVEQLKNINENLNHQIVQHKELINQIDKLPKLLESFPGIVENQKQLTENLFEQLKLTALKEQQFIEAVEKIPTATAKQTDALTDINHQLAAAADVDVQMVESFNKFNEVLAKLDQSTSSQTDSITQMNKTFEVSDRYLKYIIARQNKRLMWIFVAAISVCLFAILTLAGIIIYLW
jgi:chromosome segregation ATPase